jgi:hypothetical protein
MKSGDLDHARKKVILIARSLHKLRDEVFVVDIRDFDTCITVVFL